MTEDSHFEELLRAANPVDEAQLGDPAESAFAQRLLERIVDTRPSTPQPRQPRRRRAQRARICLVALLTSVGGGAGVSYALAHNQPTKRAFVACYAEPDLGSDFVVLPAGNVTPIAGCQAMWSSGKLGATAATADDPLTACLLPAGGVGIFPHPARDRHTCEQLHLRPVTPLPPARSPDPVAEPSAVAGPALARSGADSIAEVSDTIIQGLSVACLDADQAKALIGKALSDAGLDTWTVMTTTSFSASRPCASPGFDEDHEEVVIIPIPPRS